MAERIVSFIAESEEQERAKILQYCRDTLPPYMIPKDIFFIYKIPLNDNGKFDKQKLINILKAKT
jgi:acyl-CoA synthetase (AMP-forming)/AMP-acid ligase II